MAIGTAAAAQVRAWAGADEFSITPEAVALLIFNLLDGLFTLAFLELGVAQELNPLMRAAWGVGPIFFMLSKLAVVDGGLIVLCVNRSAWLARVATVAGAVLYAAIVAYHLTFLWHLLH